MENSVLQSILGSKVISFHAIFAKAIGSVPAGLMLSQGLFWQEQAKYKDFVLIEGEKFFAKSAAEWYEETGITEEQQKTARMHLNKCLVLREKRAGLPATMHYRIDLESLVAVISRYLSGAEKVAADNRNKKREITRTGSGKNPGQFAVINGNNKESLETKGDNYETKSDFENQNRPFDENTTDADFIVAEVWEPVKTKIIALKKTASKGARAKGAPYTESEVAAFLKGPAASFFEQVKGDIWPDYLDHRREQKNKDYASAKSHALAFSELYDLAKGQRERAEKLVNICRARQWTGIAWAANELDRQGKDNDPGRLKPGGINAAGGDPGKYAEKQIF